MSLPESNNRDWSFILEKHRLGKAREDKKDPKSFSEGKKRFKYLAKPAGIPKRLWDDKTWKHLEPEPIIVLEPVKGKHPFRISVAAQKKWIRDLLKEKEYKKRGCIIIFGDYLAEAAERIGFGIISYALRHNSSARAFHPLDLSKGPPKDLEGKEIPYDVVFLNRIHTDDEGPRRGLVRDFVNKYYAKSFKIILIYGNDPIEFFYKKIGISPQAMFMFPYQGQLIRSNDIVKEH